MVHKNEFTYSEVIEFLNELNGKKVDNINDWLNEQLNDGLSDADKLSFICQNEAKIMSAIKNGHKACDKDEFAKIRLKIKKYRKELGLI